MSFQTHSVVREDVFATPPSSVLRATTLALDLGTKTGYSVGFAGTSEKALMQTAVAGTLELLTEKEAQEQRSCGLERLGDARYYRLRDWGIEICNSHNVKRLVFEDVKFCHSAVQTQLWGSLRAALWEVKDRLGLEIQAMTVPTLKCFACNKPHADKAEMEVALRLREEQAGRKLVLGDDNEIDARWLLAYALAVDEGARSWNFGWRLQHERKNAARARAAQRKLERKERLAAIRADGLSRLDTLVRNLGESMSVRAAQQAVMELGRSKRHTLQLKSHVIVGFVLKCGGLRWQLSRVGLSSRDGTAIE